MPTNLAIDDKLLAEALRVGGHRTKRDTVTEALEEYIRRRKQARLLDLFGRIDRCLKPVVCKLHGLSLHCEMREEFVKSRISPDEIMPKRK